MPETEVSQQPPPRLFVWKRVFKWAIVCAVIGIPLGIYNAKRNQEMIEQFAKSEIYILTEMDSIPLNVLHASILGAVLGGGIGVLVGVVQVIRHNVRETTIN